MLLLETPLKLKTLAEKASQELSGQLALLGGAELAPPIAVKGDPETVISSLAAYDEAGPGAMTFAVSEKYLAVAQRGGAAAAIVPPDLSGQLDIPALVTSEPRLVFAIILGLTGRPSNPSLVSGEAYFVDRASVTLGQDVVIGHQAYIGPKVKIGRGSVIAPGVYIEDGVEIGEDCLIHPRAVLRWGVKIGNRCQVHAGAVIGEDGFGYTQVPDPARGRLLHVKNPHLGGVVIEDDVEIGALAAIDRGLAADTMIGSGTKIDNLVQIGHNCRIKRDCVIVSQTGIAGHSVIGSRAFLLGQSGFGPGVTIGDDAIIAAQAGVSNSVPPGRQLWSGTPARPNSEVYQNMALSFSQLPKLRKFFQLFKKSASFQDLKEAFFTSGDDRK